jgi:O-antigen/teichoic acid export membrane protein
MDSVLKPTLVLMTGRALAFAATFLIPVALARAFDQDEFGTYKQLFLIFSTLFAAAPLGMAESLYYFVPRDPRRAGRYIANATVFLGAAGLAGIAALAAFGPRLAEALANPRAASYLVPIGVFAALMLVAAPLETLMIARHRYRGAASTYALSDLLRAALFAVPAALTGSLAWLVAGAIALAALRVGYHLLNLVREFGPDLRPDLALLRSQLGYALPFGAAALVEIAQGTYHQYAVSYRFGAAAFAVYAVGCLHVPLVDFIAGPAGNVTMVRMAELREDPRAVVALWHLTIRQLAMVFVPLVVLLELVAADVIVGLYTPQYAASVPIFRVWCLMILLYTLQTDAVLRVHAQTRYILAFNLARLGLVAASITWSLNAFGLLGGVLTALAALALAQGMALARLGALLRTGLAELLPWRTLARILAVSVAAGVPALFVRSQLDGGPLPRLGLVGATFALGYATLAPLLLSGAERQAITVWVARRWQRLTAAHTELGS